MMRVLDSSDTMEPGDVAVSVECSSLTEIMMRSMGSISMQDAFLSTVTEGRVDPAFHPPGVGKMGTVRPTSQERCIITTRPEL